MTLPESRRLKNAASESIKNSACDARKLAALHTAVLLAVSLVVLLLDFVLEERIGSTGGLSGRSLRSALTTAQTVLRLVQIVVVPFWQIGWIYSAMKIARRQRAYKEDLTEGFRQFSPFLRLTVLKGAMCVVIAFAATYAGSIIVMMSPLTGPMMGMMTAEMTEAEMLAMVDQLMLPVMIVGSVLAVVAAVPFFYFFGMAEYVLLDNPKLRAADALRTSWKLVRHNMWKLLRLDVSFWWFWLLSLVVTAVSFADELLPLVGITLPWADWISYFAAFVLASVAQLALHYFGKAKVGVTRAHAYLALLPKEE